MGFQRSSSVPDECELQDLFMTNGNHSVKPQPGRAISVAAGRAEPFEIMSKRMNWRKSGARLLVAAVLAC